MNAETYLKLQDSEVEDDSESGSHRHWYSPSERSVNPK
jgi:hypothetical protein